MAYKIICPNPNCGYTGKARREARGSITLGCLLSLILLFPGLIYFSLMGGYRYYCPVCGVQVATDN